MIVARLTTLDSQVGGARRSNRKMTIVLLAEAAVFASHLLEAVVIVEAAPALQQEHRLVKSAPLRAREATDHPQVFVQLPLEAFLRRLQVLHHSRHLP